MAFLRNASQCVCGTCKGSEPATDGGYGGWICSCKCHKAKPRKLSNREIDFMIAEYFYHDCLDALGCPPGKFIGKRLSDWCELKGVKHKTAFGSEVKSRRE
jgi:hypothetical protein